MNIFPDSLVMAQTCNKGHEGLCHGVPAVCVPGSEHRYRGQEEMGLIPDSAVLTSANPEQELGAPTTVLAPHFQPLVSVHPPTQWPQSQQNPDQELGSH